MEVQVNYQGVELVLNGVYSEEEEENNVGSWFEIKTVETLEGSNITNLLRNEQIEDLENLATEKIEE